MPKYAIPNLTGGIDTAIVDTVKTVPIFAPMLLVFVFGIVFIGGIVSQKRRTGTADAPMWGAVAGLATFLVALPLTLTEGLLPETALFSPLVLVTVITIIIAFWLFTSRNRNEV